MSSIQRRNPNICIGGRLHRKQIAGMGMGSVLLNKGGAGSGSSYPSVMDYERQTGQTMGEGLNEKLSKLIVKPLGRKPKNISFD